MFNQCCIFAFWFSKRTDQSSIYPAIWLSGGWRALPHILGEICPSHLSLRKSQLHAVQLDNFLYKLTSVATASWHFFIHLDIFGVVAAFSFDEKSTQIYSAWFNGYFTSMQIHSNFCRVVGYISERSLRVTSLGTSNCLSISLSTSRRYLWKLQGDSSVIFPLSPLEKERSVEWRFVNHMFAEAITCLHVG